MSILMMVNGMDRVSICYISEENLKYNCNYAIGGELQQYSYHTKTRFNSPAEAIEWYFSRFPDGNVLSMENFLELQYKLMTMKISSQDMTPFDPLKMEGLNQSRQPVKNNDGSLSSDFE